MIRFMPEIYAAAIVIDCCLYAAGIGFVYSRVQRWRAKRRA